MSLDAWGDDDSNDPYYDAGYAAGRAAEAEEAGEAYERVAAFIEGYIGAGQDDTQLSAKALAMSVRALVARTDPKPETP